MAETLYILSSPFGVGQKVYRKMDDCDEPFTVVGFIINYVNERGDVTGYDILLSDMDGNIVPCKPFELTDIIRKQDDN